MILIVLTVNLLHVKIDFLKSYLQYWLSTFSWCFSIFFRCFLRFHQLFRESSTFSWCCTRAPSSSGVHQFFRKLFSFFRCCKRNTGFFFSFTRLSGSSPPFFGAAKKHLPFLVFTSFFQSFFLFLVFSKNHQIFPKFSPFFRCCQSSSFFRCSPDFSGVLLFFPVFLLDPIRFFSEPPWIIRKLSRFSLRVRCFHGRFALTVV